MQCTDSDFAWLLDGMPGMWIGLISSPLDGMHDLIKNWCSRSTVMHSYKSFSCVVAGSECALCNLDLSSHEVVVEVKRAGEREG